MVGVYIACAFVLGLAARALGMPPLVGFLAAGFALDAAGLAAPDGLEAIAHAGVLLMLFTVGMKVRLRNIVRVEVWGTALLHLAVSTALLGILIVYGLGTGWVAALLVACALGFSSTVVVAKSLDEKRELRAFHGRVAIGILIVQDLAAIAVLGLSQGTAPSPWAVALLALLPARRLVHRLLDVAGHGEILLLLGVGLALAGGYGFEALGLSGELGALVLGALLADHPKAQELADTLWGLKEAFLVGFFLLIGMSGLPGQEAFVLALVALALLPLKGALFYGLLVAFKLRARSGVLAGLALANYSEFGLIVAQAAAARGLLPESWVVALAITVALSFAVSAPLNRASHAIYARLSPLVSRLERRQRHPDDKPISIGAADVMIFGMGRVGLGAYEQLKARGMRVVGLDSDPGEVARHLAEGRRVVYGDAEDSDLWHRLRLDGLSAVLLAVPDIEAKRFAIHEIRRAGYRGMLSATNVYPEEAGELLDCGCTTTYNYYEHAGAGFAERVWTALREADGKAEHPERDA